MEQLFIKLCGLFKFISRAWINSVLLRWLFLLFQKQTFCLSPWLVSLVSGFAHRPEIMLLFGYTFHNDIPYSPSNIWSLPCHRRCLHCLLDSWTGLVTAGCVLPAVQRPGLWEVLPPPCWVQFCHESHHLLLPRQRDERHFQADPVLPAQWKPQWSHRRLWPLSLLPQPHHSGWSSQQWPLCGLEGSQPASVQLWTPTPHCQGKVGSQRRGRCSRT